MIVRSTNVAFRSAKVAFFRGAKADNEPIIVSKNFLNDRILAILEKSLRRSS